MPAGEATFVVACVVALVGVEMSAGPTGGLEPIGASELAGALGATVAGEFTVDGTVGVGEAVTPLPSELVDP